MKKQLIVAIAIIATMFAVSCGQTSSTTKTSADSTLAYVDSISISMDSLVTEDSLTILTINQ
jgi:hypothetical protein